MADEYRRAFLELLNNQPISGPDGAQKPRDKGFVVLIPGKRRLELLQSFCFATDQTHNTCYTVRYRIAAGSVFGTLFVTLVRDLLRPADDWKTRGVFQPELEQLDRKLLISAAESLRDFIPENLPQSEIPEVPPSMIKRLLDEVGNLTRDAVGKRFVLFCEVEGEGGDPGEWEMARSALFNDLPERVGLVFSGAPDGFELVPEQAAEMRGGTNDISLAGTA